VILPPIKKDDVSPPAAQPSCSLVVRAGALWSAVTFSRLFSDSSSLRSKLAHLSQDCDCACRKPFSRKGRALVRWLSLPRSKRKDAVQFGGVRSDTARSVWSLTPCRIGKPAQVSSVPAWVSLQMFLQCPLRIVKLHAAPITPCNVPEPA